MKKNIPNIVLTAALLVVTSAGAGDFSGSYVGAKIGSNRADTSDALATSRSSASTYGLEGGHGWDVGKAMLGVDGFYDTNREADHDPASRYGSSVYGLGLKLGLPINSLMPYAKLGYAHTRGTGAISNFGDNHMNGGLGLEYKFARSWSVAGEWTTISPRSNGIKLNNDNFTVGVNYYFSPPKAAPAPAPAPVATPEPEPAPVAAVAMKEPAPATAEPEPVAAPAPATEPTPQQRESWKIIKEQTPVTIEGANFDFDSAKLRPTAAAKLQPVVDFARKYPDAGMNVHGHTCDIGTPAYNQKLSERRAEAVKSYLVKQGISASRIKTKGFGETEHIASNKTKKGRAKNRRVEIHYVVIDEKRIRVTE